ncbi:ABC transporter ATP-binding protein [Desulfosarcina sp.]|uniref:ABC transporter ATP-binding protein n=1 Tax=Desulfosarcina sp. TaxID=2027861 RepID=UPI0035693965
MTASTTPLLRITALKKYFPVRRGLLQRVGGYVRAVDGVDLDIGPRQTLGLVGESGCGKSTVARLILRLLEPDGGTVHFDGREITSLNERAFKPLRKKIQMIFQDPYSSLNPRMTVAQSICDGVRMAGIKDRSDQRKRIQALLDMVGMPAASAGRYPHEFSGGQRQRVGIARALSVSPQLVLCDEPISALDVSIQAQIINLLKDLQDELGLSYLFISHDLNVVSYICDHVCVMYRGRIVESAPALALFDHARHPYTLNLLAAVPETTEVGWSPQVGAEWERAPLPDGCAFGDQCPDYDDACTHEPPAMVKVGDGHFVRCWKAA